MFSTKNVKEINILCLEKYSDDVIDYLINDIEFQFDYVNENNIIKRTIINNEKVIILNNLLEHLKNVPTLNLNKKIRIKELSVQQIKDLYKKSKTQKELVILKEIIKNKIIIEECYKYTGKVDGTILIKGWIKKWDEKKLIKDLAGIDRKIIINSEIPKNAPVVIKNPYPFKPFELLTRFYSAPRYGDIDPTPIFALTFMICFGIMFSDVFDGTILIVIGLIAYFIKKLDYSLLIVMLGIGSLFFGFMFGEGLGGVIKLSPILFNPFDEPLKLLYIAIGFGLIHISIGHFIGFINSWRRDGLIKGITRHLSVIMMIFGTILIFVKINTLGLIFLLSGSFLIIANKEIKHIVELPSLIGNTISYSRLLAINMAHIGIGRAFFLLGSHFNIFINILFITFGQIILLTLDLIISFVHSLRLHFVEFFTKFMEQGEWFTPLKGKRLNTKRF